MISAVAILMLCNGIRISLKSKKYNQRNRVCHGVHDTPFSFLHFFVSSFFSSDFTDESDGNLAYRITHGFARIFGRWPMARARYVLLLFLVTQIFYGISNESLCPIPGGYLQRPNRSPPRNSVSSDDEKNLRHLRNLRD